MAVLHLPRGLITDLITPLKGVEIDGRSLGRHLDRVLPYTQAIFLAGPYMGGGRTLAAEQRADLFEKTLVVTRGKVPVLVWVTGETEDDTRKTLLLLKKRAALQRHKGSVFWVDTPLYYRSNRGLARYYEELVSMVDEPFVLYNDPSLIRTLERPMKRDNIRTNILKELGMNEGIAGLIFSGSLDRAYNYRKALQSRSGFRIYDGDESNFLKHPSLSGVISIGANLTPRAWQKITSSSLKMDDDQMDYPDYRKQILVTWEYLNSLKDLYNNHGAPLLKHVLSDMGIMEDDSAETAGIDKESASIRNLMEKTGDLK